MNSSPNQDAALALARLGLHIFACNPDKTPTIKAWEQNATSNTFTIEAKWQSSPELLPAIPVGAHGMVVIDCDRKPNAADGVVGFDSLCAAHGIDLSGAFVVETPSSGLHFYWRTETPHNNSCGSLPPGIDVRGLGGYVIAPGATLADGGSYRIVSLNQNWNTIPALPEALAAFLREKRPLVSPAPAAAPMSLPVTWREQAYAETALGNEVAKLTVMREGSHRNAALNEAAHSLATMEGWIDLNTVFSELLQASIDNGYVAKDGEDVARRTIESGFASGRLKPRPLISETALSLEIVRESIRNILAAYRRTQSNATFSIDDIRSPFDYQGGNFEFAVEGLIPLSAITVLTGESGCGKTTFVTKLCEAVSEGKSFLGMPAKAPRDVLYMDRENTRPFILKRLERMNIRPNNRFKYWGAHCGEVLMPGCEAVEDWVKRHPNCLLVVDGLVAFLKGSDNDSEDIRTFFNPLRHLANLGAAIIVLHHVGKGESTQDFRGSYDIKCNSDVAYLMKNSGGTRLTTMTLKAWKTRESQIDALAFTYSNGEFIPQELKQASEDVLTQLLRDNDKINKSDFESLAKRKGLGQGVIRTFIDDGVKRGTILSRRGERNASLLSLADDTATAQWPPNGSIQ